MAYFAQTDGVVCFRVRCIHDDMDYSSAIMNNVQVENAVAGEVTLVTDHEIIIIYWHHW